MAEIILPRAMVGKNDKETIQNLYDAFYKLRKELDFLLNNLDEENVIRAGSVYAENIDTIHAKIGTAQIEDLEVGGNVVMGPDAIISYNQVSDKPFIPTLPSYITSTKITSTSIESPNITGGTLTGGTINNGSGTFTVNSSGAVTASNMTITGGSISVSNDVKVGDKLNLGNSSTGTKGVFFLGTGNISGIGTNTLEVAANNNLSLYASGDISFNCNSISGLSGRAVRCQTGQNISLTTSSTGLNVRVDGVTVGNIAWS